MFNICCQNHQYTKYLAHVDFEMQLSYVAPLKTESMKV